MKNYKVFVEESKGFPKYYKTSKNSSIRKVSKRYFKTGDKLYDVDWNRGEYHIMADTKELDRYKEHNWSRSNSRRSEEKYEELYQDIKENGIKTPVQIFLYQYEGRTKLGEGNHRLAIAKELGIKKIPVVFHFWKGNKAKPEDIEDGSELDNIMSKQKFDDDMDKQDKELADLMKTLGIKF